MKLCETMRIPQYLAKVLKQVYKYNKKVQIKTIIGGGGLATGKNYRQSMENIHTRLCASRWGDARTYRETAHNVI